MESEPENFFQNTNDDGHKYGQMDSDPDEFFENTECVNDAKYDESMNDEGNVSTTLQQPHFDDFATTSDEINQNTDVATNNCTDSIQLLIDNSSSAGAVESDRQIDGAEPEMLLLDDTYVVIQDSLDIIQIDAVDTSLTKQGEQRRRKKFVAPKAIRDFNKDNIKKAKYAVKPSCNVGKCLKKCWTQMSEETRISINEHYWSLDWGKQGLFLKSMISRLNVAKRTTSSGKRNFSNKYYLKNEKDEMTNVCQTFFLTTLGYPRTNNTILRRINKDHADEICKVRRGKYERDSAYKQLIQNHIDSFNPTISHYRREHAPNRRYLPSDLNIQLMNKLFNEQNPDKICSYDTYRNVLHDMKISFTKLGHEECEICYIFKEHNRETNHVDNDHDCNICEKYNSHKVRVNESRKSYEDMKKNPWNLEQICVSVDLQKVIMLPRMEMFKQILFAKRLVVFNESFVPTGKLSTSKKPYAAIWHEAVSGRLKEDILSTFYSFFLIHRDVKNIHLWLDNCAAQNKNWCLFSFMIYLINCGEISADVIHFHYFEPGHTFMSADSFHHQVEHSLKKQLVVDFSDFSNAVQSANNGNVVVKEMGLEDFKEFEDQVSYARIKKHQPRPLLANMVQIKFKKGSNKMFFASTYENDFTELPVLKLNIEKNGFPPLKSKTHANGVSSNQRLDIKNVILPLVPINRKSFWENLIK